MKKIVFLSTLFLLGLSAYSENTPCNLTDEGVLINGIRWATRNVDMPGTFAETPECSGMLFQWNRRKAWNAIDFKVEGWDSSIPEGTAWYAENDPCPEGWRVPKIRELMSLTAFRDTSPNRTVRTWTTQNGVDGFLFGTEPNQIFLPVVTTWFRTRDGTLRESTIGWYWSSTRYNREEAAQIGICRLGITQGGGSRNSGRPVRCVSKETMPLEDRMIIIAE